MKYIVSVSGGLGSAEALKRTIEQYGRENTVAVFCDVKGDGRSHFFSEFPAVDQLLHERFGGESLDTYRFLWQLAYAMDIPIERLEDGRTIFAVFAQRKAFRLVIGKIFFCPASEELKRVMFARYIQEHFAPGTYAIVLGMGWDEEKRTESAQAYWRNKLGWDVNVIAPCADRPYADNAVTMAWLQQMGIEIPSAYPEGFDHNNCNSGCVQAGQGHFANLYWKRPLIYLYWAWMERRLQFYFGKSYTILKDERGGGTSRMSLYDFIPRIVAGDYRRLDWGACACFSTNFLATVEINP